MCRGRRMGGGQVSDYGMGFFGLILVVGVEIALIRVVVV
jgi:hypothetical protein